MSFLFACALLLVGIGIGFLLALKRKEKQFGLLAGNRIYQDTQSKPGVPLYAKTLPLKGKPDYLKDEDGDIIPVEVKTGKTPSSPYLNHTTQLMAYCLLVQEHYGKRPKGGYLVYPEKQFRIEYTEEVEKAIRSVVKVIVEKKLSGEELHCSHPEHNR